MFLCKSFCVLSRLKEVLEFLFTLCMSSNFSFSKKSNSMNSFCQEKNLEHEEINLIYYPYFVPLWCFWWKISRNVFCIKPPFEKIWHKLRKECVKRRPPFKIVSLYNISLCFWMFALEKGKDCFKAKLVAFIQVTNSFPQ